jgi:hypothetical protein
MARLTELSGWGRYPVVQSDLRLSADLEAITVGASLSRGLGRAYGDAALPAPGGVVAGTTRATSILSFDNENGVLRAQAGVSLEALHGLLLAEGWSCPVLPGTQFVTLGIAATMAVTAYALYTIEAEVLVTGREFAPLLFVAYGVFEYLRLAHVNDAGGSPVAAMFGSPTMLLVGLGWVAATVWSLGLL